LKNCSIILQIILKIPEYQYAWKFSIQCSGPERVRVFVFVLYALMFLYYRYGAIIAKRIAMQISLCTELEISCLGSRIRLHAHHMEKFSRWTLHILVIM
jgi:hypothetical protein